MTHVTQTLSLEDTPKINSRFFNEGKTLRLLGPRKSVHRMPFTAQLLVGPCSMSADQWVMWTLVSWSREHRHQESISGCQEVVGQREGRQYPQRSGIFWVRNGKTRLNVITLGVLTTSYTYRTQSHARWCGASRKGTSGSGQVVNLRNCFGG